VYLDAIRGEAERARAEYDLLLLPGLELTYDDVDPALAAHWSPSASTASLGSTSGSTSLSSGRGRRGRR
jgi:hypothetical protein